MDDILSAVKTVRATNQHEAEPALAPATELPDRSRNPVTKPTTQRIVGNVNSPESILDTLRNEPDHQDLTKVLSSLQSPDLLQGFDVRNSGPLQAQITNAILSKVVPNYWQIFDREEKELLSNLLRSLSGINATVAALRLLAASKPRSDASLQQVADLIDVLDHIISPVDLLVQLWTSSRTPDQNQAKHNVIWKDIGNLLGSGKIISTVAQAEDVRRLELSKSHSSSWLSNGAEYAEWLGRILGTFATSCEFRSKGGNAAHLLSRALGLGYPSRLLRALLGKMLQPNTQKDDSSTPATTILMQGLPPQLRRQFLDQTLRWLSESVTSDPRSDVGNQAEAKNVNNLAALISGIVGQDEVLQNYLVACCGDTTSLSSLSLLVRRACVTILAKSDPDQLQTLLERLMTEMGDPLFIRQGPILQQETAAQTLLIVAGYIHRSAPMALLMIARSSGHMSGISNRLDSSLYRPRWLGMVVGTTISALVDKEGAKMSFGTDDMETDEAKWYMSLCTVSDTIGSVEDALSLCKTHERSTRPRKPRQLRDTEVMPVINGKQSFGPVRPPKPIQTEIIGDRVIELPDEEPEAKKNGLQPYARPDSDPEDSDEDATLVNRNKVRAPVYIRDLMSMLRDDKTPDRFQMGIKYAAPLIRRKRDFGKEVKDHAEEILGILCNLQDPFSTADFDEMRLQAMIATLLSDAEAFSPWLARQSFAGEYSISQRCIMLSTLGLAGRELAGLRTEDENLNPDFALGNPALNFPSKQLPPRLHALYSSNAPNSTKRLNSAAHNVEQRLVKPLALHAADKSTSHLNAVKIRSFSSRLSTTDTTRTKRKPQPNTLAKILAQSFFYPLMTRYQQDLSAYGSSSLFTSVPLLLTTYLRTLALLLHASGPATLNLPSLTTDFWDLLLSLRTAAAQEKTVLEAVLFSLLTLLEVNGEAPGGLLRLANDNAGQLMETQNWVEVVFERTNAPVGGNRLVVEESLGKEDAKIRTLAAGVLVRAREVVEARQKELFGRVIE